MFNVIDHRTGWKVDFILRKARPFSEQEFERRRAVDLFGARLSITAPEDAIISKLEWSKRGGSERQIDDARRILQARLGELDLAYIERWIAELGLHDQWGQVRAMEA